MKKSILVEQMGSFYIPLIANLYLEISSIKVVQFLSRCDLNR